MKITEVSSKSTDAAMTLEAFLMYWKKCRVTFTNDKIKPKLFWMFSSHLV